MWTWRRLNIVIKPIYSLDVVLIAAGQFSGGGGFQLIQGDPYRCRRVGSSRRVQLIQGGVPEKEAATQLLTTVRAVFLQLKASTNKTDAV